MRFMKEEEVLKTLSRFEGATETRRISKSALKNWVVRMQNWFQKTFLVPSLLLVPLSLLLVNEVFR